MIYTDRGSGVYGYVLPILSTTVKIAYLEEFYRNYPNVKKGSNVKYHIHNVNSPESTWGVQNAMGEDIILAK